MITQAIYDVLAGDGELGGMLADYRGQPAIFTTEPAPGDAALPYIVTAGAVAQAPFDTKTRLGRNVLRDVRCYAPGEGSAVLVEAIAERVRFLLHRQPLSIAGFDWVISDVAGPIAADEGGGGSPDVYGRILTLSLMAQEI